ncbi:MAG: hypothetical protein Q9209_002362 [Squamulea sp. 1 TL-2023]
MLAPDQPINDCPASDWRSIRDGLSLQKQLLPLKYKEQFATTAPPDKIELHGRSSMRQLQIESVGFASYLDTTVATTQHAAVSDALSSAAALWFISLANVTAGKSHGSPLWDQTIAQHTILKDYKQPFSNVICVPDVAVDLPNTTPIGVPLLPNANAAHLANGNMTYERCTSKLRVTVEAIAHPSMTRKQMFDLPASPTKYTLHWTQLDPDLFEGSSIGAIILSPRIQDVSQDVLICNIAAGWGTATLSMHTSLNGVTAVTSAVTGRAAESLFTEGPLKAPGAVTNQGSNSSSGLFLFQSPTYPEQLINISQEWAQYLNPTIAVMNTTVIDMLMQELVFACSPRVSAEQALASLVVTGLAKSGAGSQLQGTVRTVGQSGNQGLDGNYWVSGKGNVFNVDREQSRDWAKFHVDSTFQGYAYNMAGLAPRIAIAFLTLYCFLALGHVFYASYSGISSTAWDSISEVTALAMNSTPTAALRNTCAGITELRIFKLSVRVLVRNDVEGEGEHLELVFGDVDQEKVEDSTIKPNRVYGTMPTTESSQ